MKIKLQLLLLILSSHLLAQVGSNSPYPILSLPTSSRGASLGGAPVSIYDNDFTLTSQNPSLLTDTMDLSIMLNYSPSIVGVKNSYLGFAKSWRDVGNFAVGLNYVNYGNFDGYDEFEIPQGTFTGTDMAFYLQYSRRLSPLFAGGITLKPIFSKFEQYSSNGLATDIAFNFNSLNKLFSAGLILQNYGKQFSNYNTSELETFEPNLLLTLSQKLSHAPFRFLITYQNILQWDLTYNITNTENNQSKQSDISTSNNFMRHMILGVEFVPSRNFYVDLSYNGKRRLELLYEEKKGLVGYSFGFGMRVKQFSFGYALSKYHISGSSHSFTLTTNINNFKTKR